MHFKKSEKGEDSPMSANSRASEFEFEHEFRRLSGRIKGTSRPVRPTTASEKDS